MPTGTVKRRSCLDDSRLARVARSSSARATGGTPAPREVEPRTFAFVSEQREERCASGYEESRPLLPQQACNSSLWSQKVGSASAVVITSTSHRDASSPPPSSLMTSRVAIHHLAQSEPQRTTSVDASLRMSWSPPRSNSAGSF